VDIDGDGKISKGDYINVVNCPVLTYGNPKQIEVEVERVE
jgi:hypothetical protein